MGTVAAAGLLAALAGCDTGWNNTQPPTAELGAPRGYMLARGIIHLHSPYSHDACDGNGLPGGVVDESCYQDLREALCLNRIDFAMMTDHPAHMDEYEFSDLLLPRAGDVLLQGPYGPVANQMSCPNGHSPLVTVGFEDNLMPIGMTQHLDPDPIVRDDLYNGDGPALVDQLQTGADALVMVAHTESRSIDYLRTLGMDGIEIYNIHANLDPNIRPDWLGLDPFGAIFSLIPYILDPLSAPVPDLAALSFFELNDNYFEKWNTLTDEGIHVTGTVGTDSHQNVLPIPSLVDNERLDGHRRVLRWFSNHYLVSDVTVDGVKEAVKAGRGWIVTEVIGSPVGMDFYADAGAAVVGVGDTGAFVPGATTIHVPLPTLHPDSPQDGPAPQITIRLKRVLPGGMDVVEAESVDAPLDFAASVAGAYRAEVWIVPNHLTPYLGISPSLFLHETPWILTNHLYLE